MSSSDSLKIDATSLSLTQQSSILLLNINYPLRIVRDRNLFFEILQETAAYLDNIFQGERLKYQVNASYYLKHSKTQDEKLFTGSFLISDLGLAQSTSLTDFITFTDVNDFTQTVFDIATEDYARQKLTWRNIDSEWSFHSLASIIVTCQATVLNTFHFITIHQLFSVQRRRRRRNVTFNPFSRN